MAVWDSWNIWNNTLTQKIEKFYKISLCTTCMDRLYTLKECLPKNIEDNADYPNLEFVVLDYNGKDNVTQWMKDNMMEHIESGRVAFYRTEEPQFYSMSHSRNVAFKLATGDIVNNVDSDNYVNKAFASYLNFLANECPEKAAFSKGKRMMNGRLGFYKSDFIDILGGYDEDLDGYGADDHNLLYRAMSDKFKLMWYGGRFVWRIKTSGKEKTSNMKNKSWRDSEKKNKVITEEKLEKGIVKVNTDRHWGKATVIKNFTEEISI